MLFNWQSKRKEFIARSSISDEQFLRAIHATENFSESFIKCCRSKLGEVFQVDSDKIYPTDTWQTLYKLKPVDWDILEIVFALEDILNIEIEEEKVPTTSPKQPIGVWIAEFISNCSIS